jgi:hypothetical protein
MSDFIVNILKDNLFEKCVSDSFISLNCILGTSTFLFSILIISFDCYGFYKLAKYFHKINFETGLILMNILQLLIIQFLIITSYEVLVEFFNLVQIGMLTWIIRKFNILLKKPLSSFKRNRLFIFFNIINFSLIIYYTVEIIVDTSYDFLYPIILIHTSFSLLCASILTIYSCSLLTKIKKINDTEKQNIEVIFDSCNELPNSNENLLIQKTEEVSKKENDFIFYHKRENQIKPLYKINLVCTFLQLSFILTVLIIPNINFKKESYKVIPETTLSQIFYYVYIIVCIINAFTNFFCFFWRIKSQYKTNIKKSIIRKKRETIMDSGYLKREEIKIEKGEEDTKKIENIIEKEKENKNSNLIDKSLYFNSFEDLTIDNHNNTNNTDRNQEKTNEIIIEENIEIENNDIENKDILNNEIIDRESIPLDLDSNQAINRISRNTMSVANEEK